MRLIDADKFIDHLKDWLLQEAPYGVCEPESPQYKTIKECVEAVEEQPTVYDMEKVVKKIYKEQEKEFIANEVPIGCIDCSKVIEIVKEGGVE